MWYTAAKVEFGSIKVGTIFIVSKTKEGNVLARRAKHKFVYHPINPKTVLVPDGGLYEFTQSEAKNKFITPTKDMSSVIEKAIMLCEGAYC